MNIPTIGTNNHGEKPYRVYLGTGTARVEKFDVFAYNESEAVDMVADYVEENEFEGLYADYYELADLCEGGETVDEYAEIHGLICCGNHGIYLDVLAIDNGEKWIGGSVK